MGVSNDSNSNRYYIVQDPLGLWEVRDKYIGSSAHATKVISTHKDELLAIKLCRLANSAWRDVIYQANFSGKT